MATDQDVTTTITEDTVSATGIVPATPAAVFDFLRRPANHSELSGDGTVKGSRTGDESLVMGSRFGMKMKVGVPYRVSSKVVEFEEDHLIAWCHLGGHRWRWELEPVDGGTQVTESYRVTKPIGHIGWLIIGTMSATKDRRGQLRTGMEQTLQRLKAAVETNSSLST